MYTLKWPLCQCGYLFLVLLFIFSGCSTQAALQNADSSSNPKQASHDSLNDEGMWLLPQVDGLVYETLQTKGTKLSPREIYSSDSASLNEAIVKINSGETNSGTGSFISDQGLILTNYHVVSNTIASAQNLDHKSEKGFYADSNDKEIPLSNFSLQILIEQKEVTNQIQNQIPDSLGFRAKNKRAQQIQKQLIDERMEANSDLIVEINDFWSGNKQFMSVYKVIRDLRLVHAPPQSIANFGGGDDQRQWPRHSGNFAFIRVYVGPDGNSTSYDKTNVPFEPSNHIQINTDGITSGDFTMVLGYPEQTSRFESSYAIEFYQQHRNPILIETYNAILDATEYAADTDSSQSLENRLLHSTLANNLTYYQGLQQGFKKHRIADQKRALERDFDSWIQQDSLRNLRYERVLNQLDQAYSIASQTGDLFYGLVNTINNSKLLQIAGLYNSYRQQLNSASNNIDRQHLLDQHQQILDNINVEAQKRMLTDMIYSLATLPEGKVMFYLMELFGDVEAKNLKSTIRSYIDQQDQQSIIFDLTKGEEFLAQPGDSAQPQPVDPMVTLYQEMLETYQFSRKNYSQHVAYLQPAQELYVEGMLKFLNDSTAYPDANGTLRLSGGRVQGYSPHEGVYHTPFTTFGGKLAKNTGQHPFDLPQQLKKYADSTEISAPLPNFLGELTDKQVVNFLTTNDITGGNEGSPVLNSTGELIGMTLESNFEGIASDWLYYPELNRAINVDVRYILLLLKEFWGGQHLFEEIEIQGSKASALQ